MGTSFQRRSITVQITLASGVFGSSGTNRLTLTGLRCVVDIKNAGGQMAPALRMAVYGMLEQDMNDLTVLAMDTLAQQRTGRIAMVRNQISVWADGALVYGGDITNAWGDYTGAPDVFLHIEAQTAYFARISPYGPSSFPDSANVSDIVAGLAQAMGLSFENNGVAAIASNPYLTGSAVTQVNQLARDYNFNAIWEGDKLIIAPKGSPRKGDIALINKDTGLIGWPTYDNIGIHFLSLFNPNVRFFGTVRVQSTSIRANGDWIVTGVNYNLESERPGGPWFMRCACAGWVIPQ